MPAYAYVLLLSWTFWRAAWIGPRARATRMIRSSWMMRMNYGGRTQVSQRAQTLRGQTQYECSEVGQRAISGGAARAPGDLQ